MADSFLPALPPPYRCRPATAADARAEADLLAACEPAPPERAGSVDAGPVTSFGPGPGPDTLLVHDPAGRLAARARVSGGRRCTVHVHPAHRGRGLGGALLDWAETRARQAGGDRLGQTVPDEDLPAVALLRSRGYEPFVTQWLLEIALPAGHPVPAPPAGIAVRGFRPGDERDVHRLTEDAFAAWQSRRKPYEEWARLTVERDAFAPDLSPLALADGRPVGAVLALRHPDSGEGHIDRVAVRPDHRSRGIAGLLLREAFRRFHHQGLSTATLFTHSATGALPLYRHLGMTVRHSSTVYGKALRG
ncbi:GNAT family N-acetyltransferase [Kitasatospora camelliae]|uniref:GNAT family N-acetyltransferase n=1 Tax=Kitasatospora camelliae TaxID=3156397 RepID=A0AAU8JQ15_9ACTN